MEKYQEALDYINKSICTLLALQGIQDEQVIKNLHILQEVVDKATPKKPIRKRIYYNCHNGECDKTFFFIIVLYVIFIVLIKIMIIFAPIVVKK